MLPAAVLHRLRGAARIVETSDFGLIATRRTVTVPEASLRADVPASVIAASEMVLTPARIADPHALRSRLPYGMRAAPPVSAANPVASTLPPPDSAAERLNGRARSVEKDHAVRVRQAVGEIGVMEVSLLEFRPPGNIGIGCNCRARRR